MEAGVSAARGEIVAFIDDDAVPRPDWLRRLVRHFDDPEVGGVGGRDYIARPEVPNMPTVDVGRVTRWGKVIGNHHRGTGEPRSVMVLKAAGMAFRRHALALPTGLRGAGAQPHFEVAMSLSAIRRGLEADLRLHCGGGSSHRARGSTPTNEAGLLPARSAMRHTTL